MNLVQLKMLDAIVSTQSLSKAANKLHKTQPALTLAIKKLEQELGFELLDRTQYRLTLTEKGKLFHREAVQLLIAQSHLSQLASELALGNESNFKICYEQLCHAPLYNDIICEAFTEFQSTEFSVSSGKRFASLEQVNKGLADLGIGPWFDLFHATGDLESLPIGKLDIGIVCADDLVPKQINYEQLQHYPCLAMFESEMSFDSERLSYSKGSAIMKIDDIATLKSFLVSGAGWAMISIGHCQAELDAGLLQQVEVLDREHMFSAQIRVFRQHATHHGPVARAIWQGFKQASEQFKNER